MITKKAETNSTVPVILFAIIVLAVLVLIIVPVYRSLYLNEKESLCEREVRKHSVLLSASKEKIAVDIYCPTRFHVINDSKTDRINKALAEELRKCWKDWLRGNATLFKEDSGVFCHVCSVIEFKHKDMQVPGLNKYLLYNKAPGSGGQSYADYLSTSESQYAGEINIRFDPAAMAVSQPYLMAGTIDTSKNYAAIFVYAKGKDGIKELASFLDKAGEHKDSYFIGFGSLMLGGAAVAAAHGAAGTVLAAVFTALPGVAPTLIIVGGATIAVSAIYDSIAKEDNFKGFISMPLLREYDENTLDSLKCEYAVAKQQQGG